MKGAGGRVGSGSKGVSVMRKGQRDGSGRFIRGKEEGGRGSGW